MKKLKMLVYGEPGVGKSVFAANFPNAFFITTDGNYGSLIEFGADEKSHKQLYSWEGYLEFMETFDFTKYDTVVIDLMEDLFKWNEIDYVSKKRLEHIGDEGYGKGYILTRDRFFIEISKLLGEDVNVILLMHESIITTKDRRGVEKHSYIPSSRFPDKLLDQIEGRLGFVVRAYFKDMDVDGRLQQARMLSLVPKSNEYGVIRGVDVDTLPGDIELDANEFYRVLDEHKTKLTIKPIVRAATKTNKPVEKTKEKLTLDVTGKSKASNQAVEAKVESEVKVEPEPVVEDKIAAIRARLAKKVEAQEEVVSEEVKVETKTVEANDAPEKVETKKEETVVVDAPTNKVDKMAAIKAKLAAIKAAKQ